MTKQPTPFVPEPGTVVVIDGDDGAVWRVERVMEGGALRCFSYRDGSVRVVDVSLVRPCPDNARAG